MKDNQRCMHALKKVRERFAMVLDYHLPNGKPLLDSDRDLLEIFHRLYDDGVLDFLVKQPLKEQHVIQQAMFTTPEAQELPFQDDKMTD